MDDITVSCLEHSERRSVSLLGLGVFKDACLASKDADVKSNTDEWFRAALRYLTSFRHEESRDE